MSQWVASRYTILIELKDGRSLAYNALSGGLAIFSAAERAIYQRMISGTDTEECDATILAALEYGGFVVKPSVDELQILRQQYVAHRYNPNTMTLTIAPTMACNFACDYCFQGQNKPHMSMSAEVQDALLDLIERAVPRIRALGVCWYGGEPLTRHKLIESLSDRMISFCATHGIRYEAMIVTNGYLLSLETAKSLFERKVQTVQVTLDGTPEYHDSRRYLLSGQGTFERIIENLKAIVDDVPIGLSIRVNIDSRNHQDIRTLIDYMAAQGLAGKKNLKMYFAPIEAITEGCHNISLVTLSKSNYGKLEAELYRRGYEVGLTQLPYPPRFHGTCSAVRPGGLVVLPSGDLHKCWDTVSSEERRIGTLFDIERLAASEEMFRWLNWTPFSNEACCSCKLLPNCAGACAYKFVYAEKTRGEAAGLPCPSWKYNIKERLVQRAVAMGALTEKDYDLAEVTTDPNEVCAGNPITWSMSSAVGAEASTALSDKHPMRLPIFQSHRDSER
jgi:uncharacterized protein